MEVSSDVLKEHGKAREIVIKYSRADKKERADSRKTNNQMLLWAFQHIWACVNIECGNCWQELNDNYRYDKDIQRLLKKWEKKPPRPDDALFFIPRI